MLSISRERPAQKGLTKGGWHPHVPLGCCNPALLPVCADSSQRFGLADARCCFPNQRRLFWNDDECSIIILVPERSNPSGMRPSFLDLVEALPPDSGPILLVFFLVHLNAEIVPSTTLPGDAVNEVAEGFDLEPASLSLA